MTLAALETHDLAAWRQFAASERNRIETRLFIDGEFIDAADGGRFTTYNPATGEALAEMAKGTGKDIDRVEAFYRDNDRTRLSLQKEKGDIRAGRDRTITERIHRPQPEGDG